MILNYIQTRTIETKESFEMNRLNIIWIFSFFVLSTVGTSVLNAQNIWKVDTMYLKSQDLRNYYTDKWNNPLAKIVIPIALKGVAVDKTEMVDSTWIDRGRIFVLVFTGERDDAKEITLLHDDFTPLRIVFSKYGIDKVEGKKVYVINIDVHNEKEGKGPNDYDSNFKVYAGLGINPVFNQIPLSVNVGFDYSHWNVWLSVAHSLASSDEKLYVYNIKNEMQGSHKYSYLRLGLNFGYEWEPWEKVAPLFSIMPQAGIAWDQVYSDQKDINANGFSSYNLVVGARLSLKTNNRRFCFFATPEYNLNLGSKPKSNYEEITNSISSLNPSFGLQFGVLYYF